MSMYFPRFCALCNTFTTKKSGNGDFFRNCIIFATFNGVSCCSSPHSRANYSPRHSCGYYTFCHSREGGNLRGAGAALKEVPGLASLPGMTLFFCHSRDGGNLCGAGAGLKKIPGLAVSPGMTGKRRRRNQEDVASSAA